MTGIAGCCARAASGHVTAAPPSAASNSRRPMVTVIAPPARGAVTEGYHVGRTASSSEKTARPAAKWSGDFASNPANLLDHLVGDGEQAGRHRDPERLRRDQVDRE